MNGFKEIMEKIYTKKIISIIIVLQPIIDILTFFMKEYANMDVTVGVVIRTLFLLYALIYIIFSEKITKNKKNGKNCHKTSFSFVT